MSMRCMQSAPSSPETHWLQSAWLSQPVHELAATAAPVRRGYATGTWRAPDGTARGAEGLLIGLEDDTDGLTYNQCAFERQTPRVSTMHVW